MDENKRIDSLSFETALSELQDIVKNIETGKDGLEKIISAYERGNALRKHCENKLNEAKLKISKIIETEEAGEMKVSIQELK